MGNKFKITVKVKTWTVSRFVTGAIYDGEWLDNRKHGQGTYFYTDGSRYEGMTSNFTATVIIKYYITTNTTK